MEIGQVPFRGPYLKSVTCEVRSAPAWHALLSGRFRASKLCATRKARWGSSGQRQRMVFLRSTLVNRAWQTWRFSVFQCLSDYIIPKIRQALTSFLGDWKMMENAHFSRLLQSQAQWNELDSSLCLKLELFRPMISQLCARSDH